MKKAVLAMGCALVLFLTSCSPIKTTSNVEYPTYPPFAPKYSSPIGDAGMMYMSKVTLYLPSRNGLKLLAVTEEIMLNHMENKAEAVCKALLSHPGNDSVRPLGGSVLLSLFGSKPVETSSGVCTVNLHPSAAQLDNSDLYKVCLSIAATLCELPDVNYVNVLVANQAVALDITGTLPMGSISGNTREDISVQWEQTDSKKAPLGSNPALVSLSSAVSLYFPVASGIGIMPETRNITFTGQSPAQLVLGLISEMSYGARYLSQAAPMPDITSLMTLNPEISSLEDGSKMISLYFPKRVEELLDDMGIDAASFFGAIAMTIFTFVPAVSVIRIFEGNVGITSFSSLENEFENGKMYRSSFTGIIVDSVEVYVPSDNKLIPCYRTVDAEESKNLRMIIRNLMEEPSDSEKEEGAVDIFPAAFSNSDIVGVSVIDDTLLVNLSLRVADAISAMSEADEQMLCFSIVNTICKISGFNRVCFFFEGKSVERLAGGICWNGEFQPAPGMNRQNAG